MATESDSVVWTLQGLLDLFDVPFDGADVIVAETGLAGDDDRQVVEGTQVLAQAIALVEAQNGARELRALPRPGPSALR